MSIASMANGGGGAESKLGRDRRISNGLGAPMFMPSMTPQPLIPLLHVGCCTVDCKARDQVNFIDDDG
jgi:PAB1-binding protein PBP1